MLCAVLAVAAALLAAALPPAIRAPLVAHPWKATATAGLTHLEVEVGQDRRLAWTLRSPGRLGLQADIPQDARLRFALHVEPPDAAVRFRLLADADVRPVVLHEEVWRRSHGWVERAVDLRRFAGRSVELELEATGADATISVAQPALLGRAAGRSRPNVILYVVDCLRADHVGAYGYGRPTTPQLDRLAADGVLFENVHACASWTKPSVGCLFTGLYPAFHGAQTVDDVMDTGNPTLAELFRAEGYATAAWIANPFVSANPFGLTRGFEQVVQVLDKPARVNINDLPADAADITRGLAPWLKENADRQFFLYLHSLDLHAEYRRRPPFDRLFLSRDRKGDERQVDLYDNELAYNDHEIGELVRLLKGQGLFDHTILAVTADHGEEFGEHGFTRHGHTLFEALLHVPLIVHVPRWPRRGQRVDVLASNLDVAPTLLDMAGLRPAEGFQGLSLRPALEGAAAPERPAVFAEQLSPKEVLYAGRDRRYKYIDQLIPSPQEMLFDLTSDPGETRDLWAQEPERESARGLIAEVGKFMQIGQAGYHISLSSPEPEAHFAIHATTEARFGDVQRFALVTGETLTLTPDRKELDYEFQAGSVTRHLVLRTEPPGADVQFAISRGGRLLDSGVVGLGADGHHPPGLPFTLQADGLRVSTTQVAELLKPGAPAVKAWYVQAPTVPHKASLDPELEQKLKALGYLSP